MNTSAILSAIDLEISRLEQARALLQGPTESSTPAVEGKRRGRPPGKANQAPGKQTRTMSEEGRARIAAAQKARWAAKKKAETKAAAPVAKKSTATAKQVPVKKATAVKSAAAKATAVPGKPAPAKKAAVPAGPAAAKKVDAQNASPAVKKAIAKKSAPAKAAPKKRAAESPSRSGADAPAVESFAETATADAPAPTEVTAGE